MQGGIAAAVLCNLATTNMMKVNLAVQVEDADPAVIGANVEA